MNNIKKLLAAFLVAVSVFSMGGCLKYTSNILEVTTRPNQGIITNPQEQTTVVAVPEQTTVNTLPPQNVETQTTLPQQGAQTTYPSVEYTTAAPQPTETTTAEPQQVDPSTWNVQQILDFTTDAVTKTKAYTAKVTVDHKESFTANITKAPGGTAVKNMANSIVESVVKPTDEVLTFNGGTTVNGEGETVPLLLPKRGAFTLTADGVASASAKKEGENTVIKITLVKEVGTLTEHPKHQAASVGYLDASDVDLGPVSLNYLNITYTGSTIDLVVNADGYVVSADYKIPIKVDCEGSVLGATAQVECEGQQSETWKINW